MKSGVIKEGVTVTQKLLGNDLYVSRDKRLVGFIKITPKIFMTPPLLAKVEEINNPFAHDILETLDDQDDFDTKVAMIVANYLNQNCKDEYILYNFSDKKTLQDLKDVPFQMVMDYSLPVSETVEGGYQWCGPPSLDRLFMIVIEMASWLNNSEDHKLAIHVDQKNSTNPYFVLSCLIAYM